MSGNVREIAERAGVSIATVSRVIHGANNVKAETYDRVLQVMKDMNIQPTDLMRNVKMNKGVIGVLIPDLKNPFFTDCLAGIELVANQNGLSILICHTCEDSDVELQYLQLLKKIGVAGIIITVVSDDYSSFSNEYLNLIQHTKTPVVLLDRDTKYANYDGVFIDNEHGAFAITEILLKNGHRRIALIGGPLNTKPGREREEGFRDAFKAMGVPVKESLIRRGDFTQEYGEKETLALLQSGERPTAIFCANNLMTIGCVTAVRRMGLRIPEDIAVVAFDDVKMLSDLGYSISTVGRPSTMMGNKAMKLLLQKMESEAKSKQNSVQRVIMPPTVILRGSEKRMPHQDCLVRNEIKHKKEDGK